VAVQVALILVLHFGCGGGLKGGSAACHWCSMLNRLASGGICLGLFGCIWSIILGTYELSVSQSGINIQWGEPAIATAIVLAKLILLNHVLEFFAPEAAEATSPDVAAEATNHNHNEEHEAGEDLTDGNAEAAEPASVPQAASASQAGVSESMKIITSRAPGIILGLVALQMGSAETSSVGLLNRFLTAFSVPFRVGFPLCAAAMVVQVFMLLAFAAYHCEVAPRPEPPLDATGTLQWEPESETGRKVVGNIRAIVLLELQGGLVLGVLGLGLLPLIIIKLAFLVIVYPCMPKQGKSNVLEAIGWKIFFFKSCLGAIGTQLEAHFAERRRISEAAAAQQASEEADRLAAEETDTKDKKDRKASTMSEGGDFNKKERKGSNMSPKKAAQSKKKPKK